MTGLLVFAVIPIAAGEVVDGWRDADRPPDLALIQGERFAAVVAAAPDGDLRGLGRATLLPWLLVGQRVVERLLPDMPVLPVTFGTVIESEARVRHMLDAGAPALQAALHGIDGCWEMNLAVRWSLDTIVARVMEGLPMAMRRAATAATVDAGARQELGVALADSVQRERLRTQARLADRLRRVARDISLTTPAEPERVADVAMLIPPTATAALDAALKDIDAEFEGGLGLRLVGPLAPQSFASIEVRLAPVAAVPAARALLDVGADADRAALKTAYRAAVRRVHPDLVPDLVAVGDDGEVPADGGRMAALTHAYRILEAEHAPIAVHRKDSEPLA